MQDITYLNEIIIIILIVIALLIIYYYARRFRREGQKKDYYLAALEHLLDGEDKKAIQKFKEAVREDTENIDAYLRLGDLLREKGLTKSALKIHKDLTFRSDLKPEFLARVNRSLMLDYEADGDLNKAAEYAKKLLIKENPFYKEAATKLLTFYEKQLKWQEAYESSKKYFKPVTGALKKKMALYLVFQGLELLEKNGKEARIKFKEAFKTDPECAPAYYYLGKSYYMEERLDDAIREWKAFCKKLPKQAHIVFNLLERAWFETGSFSEAENLYNDLLSDNSENIAAAMALVRIYDKKGEYDRAHDLLERMEELYPNDIRVASYHIQILFNKTQYKNACMRALQLLDEQHYLSYSHYNCEECQYSSEEPLWICPRCKSIDSFNI
ncbi:MAG: hypothetical protein Kow0042_10440 [Calditrichia bacterium]